MARRVAAVRTGRFFAGREVPGTAAPTRTLPLKAGVHAGVQGTGPQRAEAAMTIYPLEFCRRAEEKWRHRAEPMRASERPARTARANRNQANCLDRAAAVTKGGLPPA